MRFAALRTRFGMLDVGCTEAGVTSCAWREGGRGPMLGAATQSDVESGLVDEALAQLRSYFAGRLARFELPLVLEGTPFEVEVWRCVAGLSVGDRASYGEIARAGGRPGAHRGVARAMGNTPLAVLIPAHRIVGSDGRIRGAEPESRRAQLLAFETKTQREVLSSSEAACRLAVANRR